MDVHFIQRPVSVHNLLPGTLQAAEEGLVTSGGRGLPEPDVSKHIWQAFLPKGVGPGTHIIHVRTTDMFGHLYTGQRVIRIE